MKRNALIFLFSFSLLLLIFSSCKKSSPGGIASGLRATINGKLINFPYLDSATLVHDTTFSLGGISLSDTSAIGIIMYRRPIIGDIPISAFYDTGNAAGIYEKISGMETFAVYGMLHITTISSTNVTGTFYFTCEDSTRVTNGEFNLPLRIY